MKTFILGCLKARPVEVFGFGIFRPPTLKCKHCQLLIQFFLKKIATPQQIHALVHVLYNILIGHISIPEENKRTILQSYKDTLLDLARPNVLYKTKKRVLVQEGSGFIEDVLAPVVSSLGFLML